MTVYTVGHGARPLDELVAVLADAGVQSLVDIRRFPGSRRHPQFNQGPLADAVAEAGVQYRHAEELGGRRSGEPGEEDFACLQVTAFRSYAARMRSDEWQRALDSVLELPAPALLCAETLWWRCHRRLVAELLTARHTAVLHLLGPGKRQDHRLLDVSEARDGRLYVCGALVA